MLSTPVDGSKLKVRPDPGEPTMLVKLLKKDEKLNSVKLSPAASAPPVLLTVSVPP